MSETLASSRPAVTFNDVFDPQARLCSYRVCNCMKSLGTTPVAVQGFLRTNTQQEVPHDVRLPSRQAALLRHGQVRDKGTTAKDRERTWPLWQEGPALRVV